MTTAPRYDVAVIGAGPGGIAAGVKLRAAGLENFVLLERADDVGGSWHENHYPGLGVDIPAVAYQYSFARNANWSRVFPHGAEVKRYHAEVARRFDLYRRVRFGTNVEREEWDEDGGHWTLHTGDGATVTARFVVSAVGAFVRPKEEVGIAGAASFAGKIQRPSDWDHDYDMRGKRVGIIGTGASAVQIIPAIAPEAGSLTVFQRTPVWSIPKPDFPVPPAAQKVLAVPGVQAALHGAALVAIDLVLRGVVKGPDRAVRSAMRTFDSACVAAYRRYLGRVVDDPATRERLTPDFGLLAKRPTMSNSYLRAYNRDNVSLVTTPIAEITPAGVRTRDGERHDFDVLILATGYEVFSDPQTYRPGTVVGRNGFDLAKFYNAEGLQAYESVSVHGLPNRWTLCGPYSWTGSGWHAFVEMTADHAVRAITETRRRGAQVCEIRKEAAEAYHRKVYERGRSLRYYLAELNGHVPTYYRNSQGDSTYVRPSGFFEARRGNRKFPLDDYSYAPVGVSS
ncbi:NAD(P)/FAD-dependent oxidoreductase [Nocardia puris]|uniref:flavin-containing monooxygenase n=1 Tax=Nocardia puris TaxID=208602 RepID=UPI0018942A9A|nr:NAD(P)/FAD-dependent oxidoreductase [Nocardia puris]MBF6209717.1 NAD(P)/FAD-dependent oxidoreductase [Nocardia puris]MBF6366289.1 NAD(P)/FAD-dependent oxidoreductase [Nocardia puris]MBF6458372.1 NAD(P)/FAD-dependent oxidoreductase [Nocardia puris]